MKAILSVQGLGKMYPGFQLEDVSFTLHHGADRQKWSRQEHHA